MIGWQMCSWCHEMNETTERTCRTCGHDAQVPRLHCACPQCISLSRPEHPTAVLVISGQPLCPMTGDLCQQRCSAECRLERGGEAGE